jgi:hypothetical protein
MDHQTQPFTVFQEKLQQLLLHAQTLINEAKHKKPYNEGLVCLLTDTIYDLEKVSQQVVNQTENEELAIDAKIVKNILEQPFYSKKEPFKKLSLLSAAKLHKEANNSSEIKEVILACVLDLKQTEVFIEDLKDLNRSIQKDRFNSH